MEGLGGGRRRLCEHLGQTPAAYKTSLCEQLGVVASLDQRVGKDRHLLLERPQPVFGKQGQDVTLLEESCLRVGGLELGIIIIVQRGG